MNPIDVLLLAMLVPFAVRGWRRGLCREGFGLLGIVGGLIVAVATAPAVASAIIAAGKPELAAYPLALAIVLLASMVVAHFVGAIVARALRAVFLGGADRVAGIVFGALKGAACLGLILILVEHLSTSTSVEMAIEGSALGPWLIGVATSLLDAGRQLSAAVNRV